MKGGPIATRLIQLPTCPPAHLPTCLPAHLPTCPPAYLPTCPPAYLPSIKRCYAGRLLNVNSHLCRAVAPFTVSAITALLEGGRYVGHRRASAVGDWLFR